MRNETMIDVTEKVRGISAPRPRRIFTCGTAAAIAAAALLLTSASLADNVPTGEAAKPPDEETSVPDEPVAPLVGLFGIFGSPAQESAPKNPTEICAPAQQRPDDFKALIVCADAYHAARDYDHELGVLDEAVKVASPDEKVDALSRRMIAHHHRKEYHQAIHDANTVVDMKPYRTGYVVVRGFIRIAMKDYPQAKGDFDRALELDPENEGALTGRGISLVGTKRYALALIDLDRAIVKKPDDVSAFRARGVAHLELKHYDLAVADFDETLHLVPDDVAALIDRGNAYTEDGKFDRAIDDYTRAFVCAPDYVWARRQRAWPEIGLGRLDDAMADFTAILATHPRSASSLFGRAVIEQLKNDSETADRDFAAAHEIDPKVEEKVPRRLIERVSK